MCGWKKTMSKTTATTTDTKTIVPQAFLTSHGVKVLGLDNAANLDLGEVPTNRGTMLVQPITMTDRYNRTTDYVVLANGRLLYVGRAANNWRKQFKKLQIAVDDGMAEWRYPDCPFEELKLRLWEDSVLDAINESQNCG